MAAVIAAFAAILGFAAVLPVIHIEWSTGLAALFPAALSIIAYAALTKRVGTERFVPTYLASLVLKIISAVICLLALLLLDRERATQNAVVFLIAYVIFTALEVGFLFLRNRPQ